MATRGVCNDMGLYNTASVSRAFAVVGGLMFVASLVYFGVSYAWWFGGEPSPWSDSRAWRAVLADVGLFAAFACHHSLFARASARRWISRHAPPGLERSIYVWIASVMFLLVCRLWQPVPGVAWRVAGASAVAFLSVQAAGAILTILAARRFSLLELAGVRQALAQLTGPAVRLDHGPFGLVRHPIYLGWFLMVWFTPEMNGTRLAFATISCAYLLMAIPLEERDLRRTFGAPYEAYMQRVRWKIMPGIY
jgi:methanethiol S-methyltransferase